MNQIDLNSSLISEFCVIFTLKNKWAAKRKKLRNAIYYRENSKKRTYLDLSCIRMEYVDWNVKGKKFFKDNFKSRYDFLIKTIGIKLRHNADAGYQGFCIKTEGQPVIVISNQKAQQLAKEWIVSKSLEKAFFGDQKDAI